MRPSLCIRALALLAPLLLGALPAEAVTIPVTTTTDEPGLDGACSLREAVQAANTNTAVDACPAGSDTATDEITIPAGTYTLSGTADEDFGGSGDLDVLANTATLELIVTGAGPEATILQACTASQKTTLCPAGQGTRDRLFHLVAAAVTFRHLTLRHGTGLGPAVYSTGAPTGPVVFEDCLVDDNHSGTDGGAVFSYADVTVTDSTFRDNSSGGRGGAIFTEGTNLDVTGSTFVGNSGVAGGALCHTHTLHVTNSTFSGNSSGSNGGGILSIGNVVLANTTITGNTAATTFDGRGGGFFHTGDAGAVAIVRNSIIAGNVDLRPTDKAPDCYGDVVSEGHNVIGVVQFSCFGLLNGLPSDHVGTAAAPLAARLKPLADNGGPTATHDLEPDSPAVDKGNPALPGSPAPACPAIDQRGIDRPRGAFCDAGAVESGAAGTFRLDAITPATGGNAGLVSVVLRGDAFVAGTTVTLTRAGAGDIVGIGPGPTNGGAFLATSFDLTGAAPGAWSVVVTLPDSSTRTLPDGFTVTAGGAPDLWAEVLVRSEIRVGRSTTLLLAYGNRGAVDAVGVPLSLILPFEFLFELRFPITAPPLHPDQPATDWQIVAVTTQAADESGRTALSFLLPLVPAQSQAVLELRIFPPEDYPLGPYTYGWEIGGPLFAPQLRAAAVADQVADAKAHATEILEATTLAGDAAIASYATDQLEAVRTAGLAAWRSDFVHPPVYSLAHLLIDAGQFAAVAGGSSFTRAGTPPAPPASVLATLRRTLSTVLFGVTAEARQLPENCRGIVLHGRCTRPICDGTQPLDVCFDPKPRCPSGSGIAPCSPGNGGGLTVSSRDPNDKSGPTGDQGYIDGVAPLPYAVFFENVQTATAAAQEVTVTDQLDAATLDLASFALGAITFGDTLVVPPPGVQTFTTDVDLRPGKDLIVRIEAGLDTQSGVVTWHLTSLDPATGELPEDPQAGLLPPNVTPPEGDGSVTFTVSAKASLPIGTEICNDARIVFDLNPFIDTPEWCNTIGTPPQPEDCENCLDDDLDGQIDRADGDCPAPADGAGAGVAPEAVKPLAKCAKALRKVGAKLATTRLAAAGKCLKLAADCVQLKPGDPACVPGAVGKCTKLFATLTAGADALVTALGEQCQPAASVLGSAAGLGFDEEGDACAARGVPSIDTVPEILECFRRRQLCTADRVLAAAVPRAAELLTLVGRNPAVELPCLTGATTLHGNLGDLGKPLRKCDAALQKAAAKLLTGRTNGRQTCAAAVFACLQEKPGNAACLGKAAKTCTAAAAKASARDASFAGAIAKSCGAPLAMTDLLAPAGLDAGTLATTCAGFGVAALDSPGALATCVGRHLACRADQLAAGATPRLRELLTRGGSPP